MAIRTGEPRRDAVIGVQTPEGSLRWISISSRTLPRPDGKAALVVTTFDDVTGRRLAEEERRRSEERYREIVETTHEGVWLVDANSRTTFVSPRMAEMLGVEPKEMIGKDPLEFVFDEDRAEAGRRIAHGTNGIDGQHDFRLRRKDGSEVWMRISSNALRRGAGPPTGALAMFTDITARRKVEEALKESEARFRLLAENSTDIIGVLGQDGVVKYHSPAFQRVTGFAPEEFLGRRVSEVYPEDRPVVERAMARH